MDRFDKLVDQYAKQYEYEEPQKPEMVSNEPLISTPQLLPLLSTDRVKRQKGNQTNQNSNIEDHANTQATA